MIYCLCSLSLVHSISPILSVCTSSLLFLTASSSTSVDYKSCRLGSVSPHFKMLLSGRVKDYGSPVQHQSNLRCGWDELSVFVVSFYVRFVSLCCNYCTNSPLDILLIHQCLVYAKALGGSDGNRWVSVHLNTLIFLIIMLLHFVWTYCRPMITSTLRLDKRAACLHLPNPKVSTYSV